MYTLRGIIAGVVGGLVVTVLVTLLLPARLKGIRPMAGAALGFGAAYLLMTLIK